MRRIAAITAVVAAAAGLAIFGTAAGDSSNYEVRAIFDDANFVIPGEDVKMAGVKVGSISGLDVTKDKKAAVTLSITQSGFQDFRTDAHCTIRPQSLIGENFVECTPTAPHPPGSKLPPKLPVIKKGPGKGAHSLPVQNTSSPVGIDEINSILRAPTQERLALIIDEFGTGLAGNGKALSAAIHRANPALQATDKVLNILAQQNQVLGNLARDSDTVLAPLSAQRQHVADFIVKANTVNQATAERSAALRANLQLLPPFLQQLRPTLTRVNGLSDEMVPVLRDLHAQAPAINRLIEQLGPFSQAAQPAVRTLGQASQAGIPAVKAFNPIVNQLDQFTRAAKPVASNLAAVLKSLRDTGGIERIMDYAFFQVAAINGFDSIGHYLRTGLIVNLCSSYAVAPVTGCSANFPAGGSSGSGSSAAAYKASGTATRPAAGAATDDPILQRTAKVLAGEQPKAVFADEAKQQQQQLQARRQQARNAAALRAGKRTRARDAKVKITERKAVLRARALCHDATTGSARARCRCARRHAAALTKRRTKLDKATFAAKEGPIALPTVQLPGGLGASDPQPLPPSPADPSTAPPADPSIAPPADPSAQQPQGQAAQDGNGATTDGQQGLFNYLMGS